MINMTKEIAMSQSLSPWDYQKESHQIYKNDLEVRKKLSTKLFNANGRAQTSKTRITTANKLISKSVIKLQARVPTQVIVLTEKKEQQCQVYPEVPKKQFLLKLPESFKVIPPKKSTDKIIKSAPKSHRELPICRQKVSYRNFKQQIQQLNKLNRFYSSHERQGSSISKNNKKDNQIIKKCSLRNIRVFQEQKGAENILKLKKIMTQSKKHILDRILSRFQY